MHRGDRDHSRAQSRALDEAIAGDPLEQLNLAKVCRTSIVLETVKRFCSSQCLDIAFEHAYLGLQGIRENGPEARQARFELAVTALHIQQKTCEYRTDINKFLVRRISAQIKANSVEVPQHLLAVAHTLLAAELFLKGAPKRLDRTATADIVLAQRYLEQSGDKDVPAIGLISDLVIRTASIIAENVLSKTTEKAWKQYLAGDCFSAYEIMQAGLRNTAFLCKLDAVASTNIEVAKQLEKTFHARDVYKFLTVFFAHQSGDFENMLNLQGQNSVQIKNPTVRSGLDLLNWSAYVQNSRHDVLLPPTKEKVAEFQEFILSASPLVLLLGVTAMQSLALNYSLHKQFRESQILLSGVIEALGWEDLPLQSSRFCKDLLVESMFRRAQSNWALGEYCMTEHDLMANINLIGKQNLHHLLAPSEFALGYLLHSAAIRQYWFKLCQSDAGPTQDFLENYASAQATNKMLESERPLSVVKNWSDYARSADFSYGWAKRHASNPILRLLSAQQRENLKGFKPPNLQSPFV